MDDCDTIAELIDAIRRTRDDMMADFGEILMMFWDDLMRAEGVEVED